MNTDDSGSVRESTKSCFSIRLIRRLIVPQRRSYINSYPQPFGALVHLLQDRQNMGLQKLAKSAYQVAG